MTDAHEGNGAVSPAPLCRLEVVDRSFLPVAGAMAADAGILLGLTLEESSRLRTATQELVSAIADEGFPEPGPVAVQVAVERRPGTVAVVVTDQGQPSHLTRPGAQPPRLTEIVRLGFADELRFANEGRRGNRAVLSKRLHYANVRSTLDQLPPEPAAEVGDDVAERIAYRALEPDDALDVARLFHRCYGFTAYAIENVYEPDRLAEMVRAGLHLGTVAEVDGTLIGHMSTTLERTGDRVGLGGELVVDPPYRRFHVAQSLAVQHAVRCVDLGMVGLYSAAVTVHTASQKIALKFGGHEVAVMVAALLPSIVYHGIDDRSTGRKAVMWMYISTGKEPHRTLHVPHSYQEIVAEIYANTALQRTLAEPMRREPTDVPDETTLDLQLKAEARRAVIRVVGYGRDFLAALQSQLRDLCLHRFEVIWVQLPLSDPLTGWYGGGLHELGCFFGGVQPELLADGDALTLQYLNDVDVVGEAILTASDFGTRLRDYVLSDHAATLRTEAERQRSRARLARIYESLS